MAAAAPKDEAPPRAIKNEKVVGKQNGRCELRMCGKYLLILYIVQGSLLPQSIFTT